MLYQYYLIIKREVSIFLSDPVLSRSRDFFVADVIAALPAREAEIRFYGVIVGSYIRVP